MSATARRVRDFYAANSPSFLADEADIRSGAADLSIHRALRDEATGAYSPDVVNADILAFLRDRLSGIARPRILDAGCGWGGTLRHLADSMPMSGVGVTLCPVQAETARRAVAGADIVIREGDFCAAPPDGPFDAIVAVESLAHTADYAASLRLLAGRLAPGGVLVAVDDFLAEDAPRGDPLLALFRAGWITGAVDALGPIRAALGPALSIKVVTDYTPRVFRRDPETCASLLAGVTPDTLAAEPDDRERCRLGGVALEQLYNAGRMRYLMAAVTRHV